MVLVILVRFSDLLITSLVNTLAIFLGENTPFTKKRNQKYQCGGLFDKLLSSSVILSSFIALSALKSCK
jgi:hypothetical protein